MSNEELFERFERTASVIEKMFKWVVALVTLTMGGVLWGAKLEWTSADHEKRLLSTETTIAQTAKTLNAIDTNLQLQEQAINGLGGKVHGVSILVGKSSEEIKRTIKEATE